MTGGIRTVALQGIATAGGTAVRAVSGIHRPLAVDARVPRPEGHR